MLPAPNLCPGSSVDTFDIGDVWAEQTYASAGGVTWNGSGFDISGAAGGPLGGGEGGAPRQHRDLRVEQRQQPDRLDQQAGQQHAGRLQHAEDAGGGAGLVRHPRRYLVLGATGAAGSGA